MKATVDLKKTVSSSPDVYMEVSFGGSRAWLKPPSFKSTQHRDKVVRRILDYNDTQFHDRHGDNCEDPDYELFVFFQSPNSTRIYVNDTDIPDLKAHFATETVHVSFDWKKLMASFFKKEIFVRRNQKTAMRSKMRDCNFGEFIQDAQHVITFRSQKLYRTIYEHHPSELQESDHRIMLNEGKIFRYRVQDFVSKDQDDLYIAHTNIASMSHGPQLVYASTLRKTQRNPSSTGHV